MSRISSFTEYALLNRWALNLFSPSAFQKLPIHYQSDSALEILRKTTQNIYSNFRNTSPLYYSDRFYLLTPLKLAYISGVTLTISRLGAIINGCLTATSYIEYSFSNDGNREQAWEKTRNYAYAFFADFLCATVGGFLTKVLVEYTLFALYFSRVSTLLGKSRLPLNYSLIFLTMSVAAVAGSALCLLSLQNPSTAAQFFARYEDRVGMYLSMALRKHLGLVNQDGGLLPFSKRDQLDIDDESEVCKGNNLEMLFEQIINAEFELIETVQKCNRLLPAGKKIQFQYPFDGEAVARFLEANLKSVKGGDDAVVLYDKNSLWPLISKLRSLQLKIKFSKEIYKQAQVLTLEVPAPIKYFVKAPQVNVREVPSYISEDYYRFHFYACSTDSTEPRPPKTFSSIEIRDFWKSLTIDSLDPYNTTRPGSTDLFKQFKYDIAVNKWLCSSGKSPKSFRELLGLQEDTPYLEYRNKKRKYWLAIHPDKNPRDTSANEIFQCLNNIIEKLDKEF